LGMDSEGENHFFIKKPLKEYEGWPPLSN